MTYTAQERLEILKAKMNSKVKYLNLNGIDYPFAPLTLGSLEFLQEAFNQSVLSNWIKLAVLSVSRVMPDITEEELDLAIDNDNYQEVINTILQVSGLDKTEDPKPQAMTQQVEQTNQ